MQEKSIQLHASVTLNLHHSLLSPILPTLLYLYLSASMLGDRCNQFHAWNFHFRMDGVDIQSLSKERQIVVIDVFCCDAVFSQQFVGGRPRGGDLEGAEAPAVDNREKGGVATAVAAIIELHCVLDFQGIG